jgi:hypothetical protein
MECWPFNEEITERRQRYHYGEVRGGVLRTGRVVRWYRTFDAVNGVSPIQPVVRFHTPDGREGRTEHVRLGAVEPYWLGASTEDIRTAWEGAARGGALPRPHGVAHAHPAHAFYVDPAHFLLFYAEWRDGGAVLGRVVGFDPPTFPDELPHPMVRLHREDGTLEDEPCYVGSLDEPEHYWIAGSTAAARESAQSYGRYLAERARSS